MAMAMAKALAIALALAVGLFFQFVGEVFYLSLQDVKFFKQLIKADFRSLPKLMPSPSPKRVFVEWMIG